MKKSTHTQLQLYMEHSHREVKIKANNAQESMQQLSTINWVTVSPHIIAITITIMYFEHLFTFTCIWNISSEMMCSLK